MSDEEFLARWSRRKHEARAVVDAPPPEPAPPPEQAEAPNSPPTAAAAHPKDVEVDLASLPSIESITGTTDITAFLRRGIPPELSRAALRRAWAADPAIRDFVGLAENAWDFNDPNAMPGFGPLDCSKEQLATLVDGIVGRARSVVDSLTTALAEQKDVSQSVDSNQEPSSELRISEAVADVSAAKEISPDSPPTPIAVQLEAPRSVESDQISTRRRTHGAALPR
ncbi:MAG: DUF3306 domain-containing protein [Alphaproteobacteria bacterium]|nr:MAG: DUF3306 domain-containing protein [Alphaproteobacteria bacterium]